MPRKPQVVFDNWDTYFAESDGKPLFISFDVEAAEQDLTGTLQHCARVWFPIKKPNKNGGPSSPESERLYEMEDELVAKIVEHRVNCRLVARVTHDGIRQLVFQLDDWESFRPPVGLWIMDHEDYEIDVAEEEGWAFFNRCIRPTPDQWQRLADRKVVDNLIEAGSDPKKEHALEFVFVGEEPGLRRVASALQRRGYVPLGKLDYAAGQIVVVKKMVLDADAIAKESVAHRALAEEHGVDYDGWGAAVVE